MLGNIASSALTLVPSAMPPKTGAAAKTNEPGKIHEAAQQFESLLIGELLKSSRGSGWLGTDDEEAGQTGIEMAEQQLSQLMASSGGLGISHMIESGLKADSAKVAANGA